MRTTPLVPAASERLDTWPLLVLDAGVVLARCRWCSWVSPRESTLAEALLDFELHVCEDPSA